MRFDTRDYDCYGGTQLPHTWTGIDMVSYLLLGSCITMALFLGGTTCHYRSKYKQLQLNNVEGKKNVTKQEKKPSKPVWKHPSQTHRNTNGYKMNTAERARIKRESHTFHLDIPTCSDLYQDEYDEHGVRIEKPFDDAELLRQYIR